MPDIATVEIPDRAIFKAAEVCELLKVQPYVLRTWEAEFPGLGEAKATGSGRVYRRDDVARVLRIKHLLLVEGLTLAGARRRIEEDAETPPVVSSAPPQGTPSGSMAAAVPAAAPGLRPETRRRLMAIRSGLTSILEMLTSSSGSTAAIAMARGRGEFQLEPPPETSVPVVRQAAQRGRGQATSTDGPKPPDAPRRKRSA